MILTQPKSTVTTSEEFQELEFGIKSSDMGLILDILRSKMYKNPIASICREIASNSRDANREAKNKKPIKIGIADHSFITTQMSIYFEDEGPGISPDRMADVFVNYGASTKRESNVETGGFGLGAKTPFSYTDSFNILTRYDGTEYTYIAAIEGGKKGKIYLLNKKDTELPNGTTILIPIDEDDREEFENAVLRATCFWEEPPIYENIRAVENDVDYIYNCDSYCIFRKNNIFRDDYAILIDGIYYDLDEGSLNKSLTNFGYNRSVVFKFKTGQLTISANREALQYDSRTRFQITKAINKFNDECATKAYEVLNETTTYIDKCFLMYNLSSIDLADDYRVEMLKYANSYGSGINLNNGDDDKKLSYDIRKDLKSLRIYHYCKDSVFKTVSRTEVTLLTKKLRDSVIYFGDVPRVSTPKNRTLFKEANDFYFVKVGHDYYYDWPELPFSNRKKIAKGMRQVIDQVELLFNSGLKIKKYSEVEKTKAPKVSSGQSKRTVQDDVFRIPIRSIIPTGGYSSTLSRTLKVENGKVSIGDNDVTDRPKFYVPVHNLRDYGHVPEIDLAKIINILRDKNEEKTIVIIINHRKAKKIAPYVQSSEQFISKIPESKRQKIADITLMRRNNEYDIENLCFSDNLPFDRFRFKSQLGNSVKDAWSQIQKDYKDLLKGAYSITSLDESFREKIFGNMKAYVQKSIVQHANQLAEKFFLSFRLLKKFPEMKYYYSREEIINDFQDYIDKMEELLMSKGELI